MTLDNNLNFRDLGNSAGASEIYNQEGKKVSEGFLKKRVQVYTNTINADDKTNAISGRILKYGEKATFFEKMTHVTITRGVGEKQQSVLLNIGSLSKRTGLTKSEIKKFHKEGTLETEIQKKLESQENIIRLNLQKAKNIEGFREIAKQGSAKESAAVYYRQAADAGSAEACIWMGNHLKQKAYAFYSANSEKFKVEANKYLEIAKQQGLKGKELKKVDDLLQALKKPLPEKPDYTNKKLESLETFRTRQIRENSKKAVELVEHFEFLHKAQKEDKEIKEKFDNARNALKENYPEAFKKKYPEKS